MHQKLWITNKCIWLKMVLMLEVPNAIIAEANTVDPDETAHDLDLQCLSSSL